MSAAEWIIEPTTESFARDVIERSAEVPIVVDFWASWCGPCRQLAPLLEQLAVEYAGKFVLAKVNTEQQPALAASFGVQSIPYVVAIRNKEIIDQFLGVLPEATLRAWISEILPSPAEELVHRGESLVTTDPAAAEQAFRDALELTPDLAPAKIGLARALHRLGQLDEAQALIADLESRGYLEPEARQIKSQIEVAAIAARTGGVDAARQRMAAHPEDPQRQMELAEALASEGQFPEALDLCLELISHQPSEVVERAKDTMLSLLQLPELDPDLASEYRRKLASALY